MTKGNTSKKVLFIAGAVLCCIFAIMLVYNLIIIIKGVVNPRVPPSVFGVTPMVVQSGSMSGNAEDHIEVGDLIFTVKPNIAELKKGDIISYMEGDIAVTHRIIDIKTDENGKRSFITKGDANNTEDMGVAALEDIRGKVVLRVPGFGLFIEKLRTPLGMTVLVLIGFTLIELPRLFGAAEGQQGGKYNGNKVVGRIFFGLSKNLCKPFKLFKSTSWSRYCRRRQESIIV